MLVTKFCGPGNFSYPKRFVFFPRIDDCCEIHDSCEIFVKPGDTNYGVLNNNKYTISDCICDNTFFTCLQRINGWIASGYEHGFKWMVPNCMQKIPNTEIYQLVPHSLPFQNS